MPLVFLLVGLSGGIVVLNILLGLAWYTHRRKKGNEERKCFLHPHPPPALTPSKPAPISRSTSSRYTSGARELRRHAPASLRGASMAPGRYVVSSIPWQTQAKQVPSKYLNAQYSGHNDDLHSSRLQSISQPDSSFPADPSPNTLHNSKRIPEYPPDLTAQKPNRLRLPLGTFSLPEIEGPVPLGRERETSIYSPDTESIYSEASAPNDAVVQAKQGSHSSRAELKPSKPSKREAQLPITSGIGSILQRDAQA